MRYIDIYIKLILLTFIILLSVESIYADNYSRIDGQIRDSNTNEPLPYANVVLVGTSLGAASDINGNYMILNVPQGTYVLRSTFIGYETEDVSIVVSSGERISQDFELKYGAVVKGKALIVTAQARGQMEAINRQLSAQSIMNVVSSAKIQELPDANAAESIGRLPGVSITRVGGEGEKVVIRGFSPKYNSVTIDGIKMASSDANNRSADLSMISSNMLESIEVSKSVTADQDADVFGGTVNFKIRKAEGGKKGLGFHLLAQGGYTGLSNAYNKYNNYKIVPSVEGRFFDERFGVFAQMISERKNLTSNEFGAQYDHHSDSVTDYATESINLNYIDRDRERTNGALVFDYRLPQGSISFSNFYSSGNTHIQNRGEIFDIQAGTSSNQHFYNLRSSSNISKVVNNSLSIEGQLPLVYAKFRLSYGYSSKDNPTDWTVTFRRSAVGISQFNNRININPWDVVEATLIDPEKTKLHTLRINDNFSEERAWMASLDLELPLNLSEKITSVIKFGGKLRTQNRSYNSEVYTTGGTFISPSSRGVTQLIVEHFEVPTNDPTAIPLSFFLDDNFNYGKFLDGDYEMHSPMQFDLIEDLALWCQNNIDTFDKSGSAGTFGRNNYLSNTNNYKGDEILTAGYVMATINIGQKMTLIPGIRYQSLQTTYSGTRGQQTSQSYYEYNHDTDTTITVTHPYFLPSVNIKYKPLSWFDIRLAYSNTISYPDFSSIIPRIDATTSATLSWNNYELKPAESKNYDVYLTFSANKIGLFTVGGFLKQIDNLIYPWIFSKAGLEAKPYYLTNKNPASHLTYQINTFVNNPFVVNNWGMEFDWQTHFWYLPNPFKGLVLDINYTLVRSEAEYPFVFAGATSATNVDSSFVDRLIHQPDHIFNFTLGYDYKDFSIRVSMLYQDDVFTGVSQWPQLRSSTAAYKRWDMSFSQTLPWLNLQLYGNISNINGERDNSVLQMYPEISKKVETYGMAANMGLRWHF